jgi:hypothetical protein
MRHYQLGRECLVLKNIDNLVLKSQDARSQSSNAHNYVNNFVWHSFDSAF